MLLPFLTLLFVGLSACSDVPAAETLLHARDGGLAPLYHLDHEDSIADEYIVMFHRNHTLERHFHTINKDLSDDDGLARFGFGYTMNLSDSKLRDDIRRDPGVLLVESNRQANLIDAVEHEDSEHEYDESGGANMKRYTQKIAPDAPYGLQMLAAGGKLSTPVNNRGNYDYVDRAGQGVNVYVLDSGIRITHRAFQGRARNFGGLAPTDKSPYCRDTMDDGWGHGTHVAGIIGARTYGVAPRSNLINVKISNNNGRGGNTARLAQAILDVIKEHNANKAEDPDYQDDPFEFRGSLINLSLAWEGDAYAILYQLQDAEAAGIKVYAAAGNSNKDASNMYPCANVQTTCIAAVDDSYVKGWFSNYGSAVNYIAPGDGILSLGIDSDTSLAKKWGTSMATAHATGAAAIFTFWQGLVNDQTHAYGDYVWWNSLSGLAKGFSGTKNLFINTGIHSPKKYNNEPFRWAGDWPIKNHEVTNANVSVTAVAPLALTTFATRYMNSTVAPISGMTTESSNASGSSIFAIFISAVPVASSTVPVSFSFDPTSSAVPSAIAR